MKNKVLGGLRPTVVNAVGPTTLCSVHNPINLGVLLPQGTTQLSEGTVRDSWVGCRNKWSLEAEVWIWSWRTYLSQQRRHGSVAFFNGPFQGRFSGLPIKSGAHHVSPSDSNS
jgi:hypothetical protein